MQISRAQMEKAGRCPIRQRPLSNEFLRKTKVKFRDQHAA